MSIFWILEICNGHWYELPRPSFKAETVSLRMLSVNSHLLKLRNCLSSRESLHSRTHLSKDDLYAMVDQRRVLNIPPCQPNMQQISGDPYRVDWGYPSSITFLLSNPASSSASLETLILRILPMDIMNTKLYHNSLFPRELKLWHLVPRVVQEYMK